MTRRLRAVSRIRSDSGVRRFSSVSIEDMPVWVWQSTRPGISHRPAASILDRPVGRDRVALHRRDPAVLHHDVGGLAEPAALVEGADTSQDQTGVGHGRQPTRRAGA